MIWNGSNYLSRDFYIIIIFYPIEEYVEYTEDKDM